jgi:hypothetical protein
MSEPLKIHPDFFRDLAVQTAGDLVNHRLINPNDFGKVQDMIRRRFAFQYQLQENWVEGDEETSVRMRMDRAEV